MAVRHRAQDRGEQVAGAAALSVNVEKAVALAETGQHAIAVRTPVVEPGELADRRNRPLQRIIEVGVLPERPLPGIRGGRRTVELFALEAHIGNDVFVARTEERKSEEGEKRG